MPFLTSFRLRLAGSFHVFLTTKSFFALRFFLKISVKMVANGGAPPRGTVRRRRPAGGGGAAAGGGASTMLQFYTDDATGAKMSPNTVLFMSIGFIAVVALLHVFGKLYLVRQ
ncbi:protein transport protein Sec61 subunit beta [Canna indica]|uniref:Protein transport protein Sec61 subunit beta n=1 Tax=Canna indica TaxID=4628 RepID=A0AAQ3QNX5_9LILI|nr:protein transport protein Sec61 subunit beta [Canna indica]